MGDHFVFMVDRLLTASTLEAAIRSKNHLQRPSPSASEELMTNFSNHGMDTVASGSSLRKLVECRICHDEDEDSNMEIPCSCRGSLKHAHRRCVQRWCNEKGDTTCEICHQHFKPDYTAPPPLFNYGGVQMNFRGNWDTSGRDLHHPQFIAMVSTDHNFLNTDLDDYSAPSPRSLMCCRLVAIIFMILLVLRHTLPLIISGAGKYSVTLFMLLMLKTIGIVLPIYIMVKAFAIIQRRRQQQDPGDLSFTTSDDENELPPQQHPPPHVIHIQ